MIGAGERVSSFAQLDALRAHSGTAEIARSLSAMSTLRQQATIRPLAGAMQRGTIAVRIRIYGILIRSVDIGGA
jgi:hypothetical protein